MALSPGRAKRTRAESTLLSRFERGSWRGRGSSSSAGRISSCSISRFRRRISRTTFASSAFRFRSWSSPPAVPPRDEGLYLPRQVVLPGGRLVAERRPLLVPLTVVLVPPCLRQLDAFHPQPSQRLRRREWTSRRRARILAAVRASSSRPPAAAVRSFPAETTPAS